MKQHRTSPFLLPVAIACLTGIAAGAPQKFAMPQLDNGKGAVVLYRGRSMLGAAMHPTLFANGDYIGVLHLANYTLYEALPGEVTITSMDLEASYPPPDHLWSPDSPCARVDWRHLASATPSAVSSCKAFLHEAIRMHPGRIYNGIVFNEYVPFRHVLDTVATREIPIGEEPTAIEGGGNYSNFRFTINIEAGKTCFVEWYVAGRGAKMRQVVPDAAEKKVRGLKLAQHR